MNERQSNMAEEPGRETRDDAARRRRYETPRLVDYGSVARLTQTGGATLADAGANMMRT